MNFTSPSFLAFLLPLSFIYFYINPKLRPFLLLVISLVSYTQSGILPFATLILLSITNFLLTFLIYRYALWKQPILFLGIIINLVPFFVFKPIFISQNFLPGLAFFTLSHISLLILAYKKNRPPQPFDHHLLYTFFFSKVLSGPIQPPQKFFSQLKKPTRPQYSNLATALHLILLGLFKKLVIADRLAFFHTNPIFSSPQTLHSNLHIFLGFIALSFQIYADFSGYTDIALGTAKLFGIQLTPNFRQPYFATSISDFWRRWHISLTNWLREFIYIPLGGNRKGNLRTFTNILIVFLVSGLWHGVGLNFILWGFFHGIIVGFESLLRLRTRLAFFNFLSLRAHPALHNLFLLRAHPALHNLFLLRAHPALQDSREVHILKRLTKPIKTLYTFSVVTLLWIPFFSTNLSHIPTLFYSLTTHSLSLSTITPEFLFSTSINLILVGILLAIDRIETRTPLRQHLLQKSPLLRWSFYLFLCVCLINLRPNSTTPFIYSRF